MNYSLRQLRVFVAVAESGNFSRAGERVGLSQSAVSHSIKELEQAIGVKLLDRTTREVLLTTAGQQLARQLTHLLEELNSTLLDVRTCSQQLSGTVRVAASQTISAHLMPQSIAHSLQCYPAIDFMLYDRPQQWVLESVRQGEVDFGMVIDPGPSPDLLCETVLSEPFFLLCREDDPLNQLEKVYWQDLHQASMVLQDYASGSRPLIDAALEQQGVKVNVVQQIGHPATLFPMVEAGIGLSIVPALALPLPAGRSLVVRKLLPVVERRLMLIQRRNRSLSAAAQAIRGVITEQARRLTGARKGDPLFN